MSAGEIASPVPAVQMLSHRRSYAARGNRRSCSASASLLIQLATGPSSRLKCQLGSHLIWLRSSYCQVSQNPALPMHNNKQLDRLAAAERIESNKSRLAHKVTSSHTAKSINRPYELATSELIISSVLPVCLFVMRQAVTSRMLPSHGLTDINRATRSRSIPA